MKSLRVLLVLTVFLISPIWTGAEPVYSPTWGFKLDLPEGYTLSGGDGKDHFIFSSSQFETVLDISVSTDKGSPEILAEQIEKKLSAQGDKYAFEYNGKKAVLSNLIFPDPQDQGTKLSGWGFFVALHGETGSVLSVFSFGLMDDSLQSIHLSLLDSIIASDEDRFVPGPVTEFSYPAGNWKRFPLADGTEAWFREGDAEAAQYLVDREFAVLTRYVNSPLWKEAWKRFYRAIYRDSFDRLKNAAFILERLWNTQNGSVDTVTRNEGERIFAEKALKWVQNFKYERDIMGSDFVNLVTAVQEGRGDCDSRAMLWAILLEQAGIRSGIMVSREAGHAMGLADLEGEGARFPFSEGNEEYKWVVAETTAKVPLGRIGENVSEISKWLGIVFN